jgi:predicted transcriptional regulator
MVIAALKAGYKDSEIAESMRVTQSAVSQYIDAHELRQYAAQSQFESLDKKYNALEEKVLDKLTRNVDIALGLTVPQLNNILRTLNQAKRRSMSEGQTQVQVNNVRLVSIKLPEQVRVKAQLNERNEIIEIDGRVVETMNNAKVERMAQENSHVPSLQQLI